MKRTLCIFCLVLLGSFALAFEKESIYPDALSLSVELNSRELLYAAKLGGRINLSEFSSLIEKGGEVDRKLFNEKWVKYGLADIKDQFIVRSSVGQTRLEKGDFFYSDLGDMPRIFTSPNKSYLIFFRRSEKGYYYDQCEIVRTHHLSEAGLRDLLSLPKRELVDKVIEEKMLSCNQLSVRPE